MVYVDTSVVLAHLGAEDAAPPATLWREPLVSSRLLAYETMVALHRRGLGPTHGDIAREVLGRIALLEVAEPIAERVFLPFPAIVRTLDALHLAAMSFLIEQDLPVRLATYDRRMAAAAQALGIPLYPL